MYINPGKAVSGNTLQFINALKLKFSLGPAFVYVTYGASDYALFKVFAETLYNQGVWILDVVAVSYSPDVFTVGKPVCTFTLLP
jgi:hypothetical protein